MVLTDESTGYYLPTISRAYVVHNSHGILHLLSDVESLERYLVFSYAQDIPIDQLKSNFRKYLGVGAIHRSNDYNKKALLCNLFGFIYSDCNTIKQTPTKLIGNKYFMNAYSLYGDSIKSDFSYFMKKYNVKYFIEDRKTSAIKIRFPDLDRVYEDENFVVYSL